jgi:hypothetical protein
MVVEDVILIEAETEVGEEAEDVGRLQDEMEVNLSRQTFGF